MIQSASYLVCFGKREREKREREKKVKKVGKKRKKKSVRKKKEEQKSDLSRLNLVVEFGLESVLCTVQ